MRTETLRTLPVIANTQPPHVLPQPFVGAGAVVLYRVPETEGFQCLTSGLR